MKNWDFKEEEGGGGRKLGLEVWSFGGLELEALSLKLGI